ncbi:hypothetical protein QOZ80_6BG0493890 [Eleusine coracana subsp. coracana]|nr:hypothetical protein QOZ80_6BG0493890 [Eleusine coracana subsp. coracana]
MQKPMGRQKTEIVQERKMLVVQKNVYLQKAHEGFNSQDTTPSVDPLDAIIQKIKILSINRPDEVAAEIPQNALVPYEGGYGALVPFEGKVKKRRSRAKVNIDPVTTLMWNLLMGPDMSDGAEGLDKDKEKWLEEERRVFRGRVDSFIARMHLVQGDRRFSPWKGSVVDSVVGVFLTQNVSDHLSSSAFMAVAAKFPAKSEVPEEHVADISHTPHQGQNDSCPGLFGDSTKLQGKLSVEEISDIRSLITTDDNEESSAQKFTDTQKGPLEIPTDGPKDAKVRGRPKKKMYDWDSLRKEVLSKCGDKPRSHNAKDTVDWEAVRQADVRKISETIRERGMNNMLAERIKEFLNRLVRDHGSVDLEWLRDVQPDKAKDYLLSIRGLGLKSVECVRLLTLHHMAFPVDTNVGRICVRLGWVPLQPLPESLQLHLLEMYPMLEQIQKYLWPRLCKLDQRTLYELHYQMITFGKVFCSKSKPNCNSCPMRAECKHFASAFASARLALPGPQEKSLVTSEDPNATGFCHQTYTDSRTVGQLEWNANHPRHAISGNHQPIIEEPPSPEPEAENAEMKEDAIEDFCYEDPDEIPRIDLNIEQFTQNLKSYMQANNLEIEQADMSKALVAITPAAASIPIPKLKNVSRLRTEHHVYELPDEHPLLEGLEPREQDDPSPYLLSIWTPGETAQSTDTPMTFCNSEETGKLCGTSTCFNCNNIRETQAQKVRGTLLIPCRTAMRGSFPLNGTYFQVNEVFADHDSSQNPIDVPRSLIWNLPRRTVYFGTSVPTIFRGLTTQEIQQCFWRGFVCVRGFDRTVRAPRPLYARFHFPASKVARGKKPGASKEEE